MKRTTYRDGIGAGPLLRPDLRGRRRDGPGSTGRRGRQWGDVLDWLHAGGRVLLRDPDRLDHAEEIRRALNDDGRFSDTSLVVVFGERSLILSAA